jgi:hypothetical protein
MTKQIDNDIGDELIEVAAVSPNTPVAPAHAIASIALSMAMKYHGINTVQDGALYQQYKLEGKNMQSLHIGMVLETAARLEAWLLGSSERIASLMIDALDVKVTEESEDEKEEPSCSPYS